MTRRIDRRLDRLEDAVANGSESESENAGEPADIELTAADYDFLDELFGTPGEGVELEDLKTDQF